MDLEHYPDDENGQVLRSLAEQGVDLTVARLVDFAHLMPDQKSAEVFARRAESLGFAVSVYKPDEEALEDGSTDWDVVCSREIVPNHANITRYESTLGSLAREFGGREDGWGFLQD